MLGRPTGEFPEEEANMKKAAALLRAVWVRRRTAGAEAAAAVAAAAEAAAAVAAGVFATAAAQAAAEEAADVVAVTAANMVELTTSGSRETLALGGHVACLLAQLREPGAGWARRGRRDDAAGPR